jgi:hypothetical protein
LFNTKRKEVKKTVDSLETKEKEIKQMLMNKLQADNLKSAPTAAGTAYTSTNDIVVVRDSEEFRGWFRESIIGSFLAWCDESPDRWVSINDAFRDYITGEGFYDNFDLLLAKPFVGSKMKDYIGEDDPPPGVAIEQQKTVGIRK